MRMKGISLQPKPPVHGIRSFVRCVLSCDKKFCALSVAHAHERDESAAKTTMLAPVKEVVRHLRDVDSPPIVRSLTEIPQPDPRPSQQAWLPGPFSHDSPTSKASPAANLIEHGLMSTAAHEHHEQPGLKKGAEGGMVADKVQHGSTRHEPGPGLHSGLPQLRPILTSRADGGDFPSSQQHGPQASMQHKNPANAADDSPMQQQQSASSSLRLGKNMPGLRQSLKRASAWLEGQGQGNADHHQQLDGAPPGSPASLVSAESVDLAFREGSRDGKRHRGPKPTGTASSGSTYFCFLGVSEFQMYRVLAGLCCTLRGTVSPAHDDDFTSQPKFLWYQSVVVEEFGNVLASWQTTLGMMPLMFL